MVHCSFWIRIKIRRIHGRGKKKCKPVGILLYFLLGVLRTTDCFPFQYKLFLVYPQYSLLQVVLIASVLFSEPPRCWHSLLHAWRCSPSLLVSPFNSYSSFRQPRYDLWSLSLLLAGFFAMDPGLIWRVSPQLRWQAKLKYCRVWATYDFHFYICQCKFYSTIINVFVMIG